MIEPHSPVYTWRTILQASTWQVGDTAEMTDPEGRIIFAEVVEAEAWGDTGANVITFSGQDRMQYDDRQPTVATGPPARPDGEGERQAPGLLDEDFEDMV